MKPIPALAAALVITCAGCSPREEAPPRVTFSRTEPSPDPAQKPPPPLKVVLAAITSPRKNLQYYEAILRYVGRKVGRPMKIIQRTTYAETNALLEKRELELAFLCSGPYVDARERFGAQILAVPETRGATTYNSYIIAGRDLPAESFAGLRGRSFAFTDPLSTTGKLYPTYLLLELGTAPDRFFSKVIFTKGHDNSVRAVADGIVDAAAVDHLIWEDLLRADPGLAGRIRVLHKSPPFGIPPIVVHPALPQDLKNRLRRTFLDMHRDPEGRALLRHAGIDRFVLQSDSAYDGVRRMMARVREASGGVDR